MFASASIWGVALGAPLGLAVRARAARRRRTRARHLVIVDPRRFGTGELLLGEEALEAFFDARLGYEPLDERFTVEHLRALARGRKAPIKAFLLDQRRMAGVGNIYADEALHRARNTSAAPGREPQRRAVRAFAGGSDLGA